MIGLLLVAGAGVLALVVAWRNDPRLVRNDVERAAIACLGFIAVIIPVILVTGILR